MVFKSAADARKESTTNSLVTKKFNDDRVRLVVEEGINKAIASGLFAFQTNEDISSLKEELTAAGYKISSGGFSLWCIWW